MSVYVKQVLRDLHKALTSNKWCFVTFGYVFIGTIGTAVYTVLYLVLGTGWLINNTVLFLTTFSLMILTLEYIGYHVYNRFISPILVRRGWNENSFGQAMLLMLILMLIFWFVPLALFGVYIKLF